MFIYAVNYLWLKELYKLLIKKNWFEFETILFFSLKVFEIYVDLNIQ